MFPSNNDLGERVDPAMLGFKKDYTVNEIDLLAQGDILLLYSDGLSEHGDGKYFPDHVERALTQVQDEPSEAICRHLRRDLEAFAKPTDDISLIVIKKTTGQSPTD
jgi:serine phosphatase RsbU (regulator of sigma subunit)